MTMEDVFGGNQTNVTVENATESNQTVCTNEECISDEDYLAMIEDHIFPVAWEWVLVCLYTVTFIVGVVGNSLVCFSVWRNKSMRTVTNIFIVNLAVADLMVILVCLAPTLVSDITETWFVGAAMCKIVLFLVNVSISVSVLTLSAISVERWYAICFPLIFKSTKKRAVIIISGIWFFAICVSLPEIVVAKLVRFFPVEFTVLLTSCRPGWSERSQMVYQFVLLAVLYAFPMLLMGFTYTHIAMVLWRGHIPGAVEQVRKPMMDHKLSNVDEQLIARRKVAKMLITVVVLFAVSYFPVHLLNILRYSKVLKTMPLNVALVYAGLAHWLPYFNSAINPVIYNFMSVKFRKEFGTACNCCGRLQKRRRVMGHGQNMSIYSNSTTTSHYHGGRLLSQTEQITLSNFHD